MVPALNSKSVSLRISPMQSSAATTQGGSRLLGSEATEGSQQQSEIVVHPGELCRVGLEIKNWESQLQRLTLKLDGTFPLKWCQVQTDASGVPQFGSASERNFVEQPQPSSTAVGGATNLLTLEVAAKKSRHTDLWFLVPDHFLRVKMS